MTCPHCGAEVGAAVCGTCGRPIPRFPTDAPRDLAFAALDGTVEADAAFDREAVERAFRKIAADCPDEKALGAKLAEVEAFLNGLLATQEAALDEARKGLARVPEFAAYEESSGELLERAAMQFGEALTELAAGNVDAAAAAAGEAMDALAGLDRLTDELEGMLRA